MDRTLIGTIIPNSSEPGCNGNKKRDFTLPKTPEYEPHHRMPFVSNLEHKLSSQCHDITPFNSEQVLITLFGGLVG